MAWPVATLISFLTVNSVTFVIKLVKLDQDVLGMSDTLLECQS